MIAINLIQISGKQLLARLPEKDIQLMVQSFSCPLDPFIEDFVQNKCIDAEKMGNLRSYFIVDADNHNPNIVAYYALTIKILQIKSISKKKAKKLHLLGNTNQSIPAYFIALLAKNEAYHNQIEGKTILKNAIERIELASNCVGGRIIWLEAKKCHPGVMNFYTNNDFNEIQEDEHPDGTYSHLITVLSH